MRLILILIVVAVIGWLAAKNFKTQTDVVGQNARKLGVDVPQSATPKEQVEAFGKAVEKMQKEQAEQRARQSDQATDGR